MYSVMRSQNAPSNVVSLYGSTHSAIRYNSKKSRQIVFAECLGAGRVPVQVTSTGERPEQLVPPPCRRGSVCRRRQSDGSNYFPIRYKTLWRARWSARSAATGYSRAAVAGRGRSSICLLYTSDAADDLL